MSIELSPDYQVDMIRHGFSCGNLYHMLHATGDGPRDPYLSDFGIWQVIDLRKRLLECEDSSYDHILTSYLRRAIETTLLLFAPRDLLLEHYPELADADFADWPSAPKITVIPYISEIGADFTENHGVGMEQLRREFRAFDRLLDFEVLKRLDSDCRTEYEHDNFLKVLYSFPHHTRIALISHGNVMRALLGRVPRNTELWPLKIINGQMAMVGEPIKPLRTRPATDKYDGRCLRQLGGKRHVTPKNSKRTRRSTKRTTRTHKR